MSDLWQTLFGRAQGAAQADPTETMPLEIWMQHRMATLQPTFLLEPAPAPVRPPLPVGDMILGEIAVWRVWRYWHGFIRSCAADAIWVPGEPMQGDPTDHGNLGVHGWKTQGQALTYAADGDDRPVVIGRAHLWGTAIEHELGWRGQFARPIEFTYLIGLPTRDEGPALAQLRERYHITPPPQQEPLSQAPSSHPLKSNPY